MLGKSVQKMFYPLTTPYCILIINIHHSPLGLQKKRIRNFIVDSNLKVLYVPMCIIRPRQGGIYQTFDFTWICIFVV